MSAPRDQRGITLALAEAWRHKRHFGLLRGSMAYNGKTAVYQCITCCLIVSAITARQLGLPKPGLPWPSSFKRQQAAQ